MKPTQDWPVYNQSWTGERLVLIAELLATDTFLEEMSHCLQLCIHC